MALITAQVILPFFTNLPRDVIVNTFHFESVDDDLALAAGIYQPRLRTFYEGVYSAAGTDRVQYVNWPAATIKFFLESDPPPRIPVILSLGIASGGGNISLIPTEVAAVLSWHSEPESGQAYQRRYNRIFLGALPSSAMTGGTAAAFPQLSAAFVTKVKNAAVALRDADTVNDIWVQVSRATGSPVSRQITGGWVDNSPDSQRRRSVLPTSRNTWVPT